MTEETKKHRAYKNVYETKDGGRVMELIFKSTDTPEENAAHYERKAAEIKKQEDQG